MTASTAATLLEFRTARSAPPDRIYAALTEAQRLARWLCDQVGSDPTEGGKVTLRWTRKGASPEPFAESYAGAWPRALARLVAYLTPAA